MKPIKKKKSRKERRRELTQQDQLVAGGGVVFEWAERNWKVLIGSVVGALMLAGIGSTIHQARERKEDRAADALDLAEEELPGGSLGLVVQPTKEEVDQAVAELEAAAKEHPGTQAARIASLRAGVLLVESERYEEALEPLALAEEGKGLVAIRAMLAHAAALDGLDRDQEAAELLERAARQAEGPEQELLEMRAARLLESVDPQGATRIYEQFLKEHPDSVHRDEVQQRLDRVRGRSGDAGVDNG